jgi:SAM-dependent methyltransferase
MAKSRSLASIDKKLFKGSATLQKTVDELLATRCPVSVLEIGCGAGRALMELASKFRGAPVRFHAINREPGHPLSSSADLVNTARAFGIDWDDGTSQGALPDLFFYDATSLHFADNSIDLVYLSSVARFIERKAEFIEEVCRVLTPGGIALVQMSRSGWDYPEGEVLDDLLVTPYPSRMVLMHGNDLVPLPTYLKRFRDAGFDFDFISAPACVLRIRKRCAGRISLGLEYDDLLSVPMSQLPYGQDDLRDARGGFRSVYRINDAQYGAMIRSVLESALNGHVTGSNDARQAAAPLSAAGKSMKAPRPLTCYQIGQRVKVKGRHGDGRYFHATKIRPNDDGLDWDELEGGVEWVDASTGTFGLLGCTIWVDAEHRATNAWERVSQGELTRGTLAKVSGSFRDGRFSSRRLIIKEPQAVIVEEIQGPISAIDAASACLEVAGFTVRVDPQTKLVTE